MQLNLSRISHPASRIPNPASPNPDPASYILHPGLIRNIIFDFGGVILNIDIDRTKKAFLDLGFTTQGASFEESEAALLFKNTETGVISPRQFRDGLKMFFPDPVSDEQIDAAWNALLLDIPEERIRLLEELKSHYRIFLLSNTSEIHYLKYRDDFRKNFGYQDFDALFEKVYFSFRLGIQKPSAEIFLHVMTDSRLNPSETLFIDDTLVHVESARRLGIHAIHLNIDRGETLLGLFQ